MSDKARCDDCGGVRDVDQLAQPKRLWERLDAGGTVPAGECPDCGALAYLVGGEKAYTVVGTYVVPDDAHQRYVATVYTNDGPRAAEDLAQAACREENGAERDEELIEIVAVIEGEAEVIA